MVSEDELSKVKSYMLGRLLRAVDGPFALLDRFKEIYFSNLDYDYFESYIETVKNINSRTLIDLANKYWSIEELYKLNVGKIN